MSPQQRVKWGQVKRYFDHKGYSIRSKGGDKVIVAPPDGNEGRTRQTVRIGHKFCTRAADELLDAHIAKIRRAFGVTRQQLLDA